MAKKKEEVNLSEVDANFIISSFKNKERRNNPSSIPRPLLPPDKAQSEQEAESEETETTATLQAETPREESKRKRSKTPDYKELFVQEVGITARTGKSVYIRKEHHEKIMKIVQVIGKNEVSLFSYIDNVLSHHLSVYQDDITELYDKHNKGVF